MCIKTVFITFLVLFSTYTGLSQIDNQQASEQSIPLRNNTAQVQNDTVVDLKYREDQFYLGITYNLLSSVPSALNIRGLSGGLHFGFLRDMPLNADRDIAIAIGGGLAFDVYGSTLFIGETPQEETIFTILNDNEYVYSTNRFSMAMIEAPVEFRWRTSSPTKYAFWRVYAGFRVGYAYWYQAKFQQDGNDVTQTDIPEFNPLRLGATLSFGYNKVNFYAYYSINPFFDGAESSNTNEPIEFKTIKLGILFYIL
ncbi:MAG: porin family protein [Marinirhabdus sp.]|nr:porin family protein [Marinirhabdus sp.]